MAKKEFFQKLSSFRKILNNQDWTPDGWNDIQGYPYITNRKIKANVSKALVEAGLEWRITFPSWERGDPIGMMKQHYYVEVEATIYDVSDPDVNMTYNAVGEAGDSGDKAYKKACTAGLVTILTNNFMLAELTTEGENVQRSNDDIKAKADSVYEANQEIKKAKVVRAAQPVQQHVQAQVSRPAEGLATESQKKVIERILNKANILSEAELSRFGSIAQIEGDASTVKSAADAQNFITTYTGILRCQ